MGKLYNVTLFVTEITLQEGSLNYSQRKWVCVMYCKTKRYYVARYLYLYFVWRNTNMLKAYRVIGTPLNCHNDNV